MYSIQHYVVKLVSNLGQDQWFSLGTAVSSINKTDCHDITEILLKVVLNTIAPPLLFISIYKRTKNLTLIFLKVSLMTSCENSGLISTSTKLAYNVWKFGSILALFMTRYCPTQGIYSSPTSFLSSSDYNDR
jgi:hypothetical protein